VLKEKGEEMGKDYGMTDSKWVSVGRRALNLCA